MSLISRRERLRRALQVPDIDCVMSKESGTESPSDRFLISNDVTKAWMQHFQQWLLDRCARRNHCFGAFAVLYRDFCEWCATHQVNLCTRQVFELLLASSDFLFAEGFVSGLILKDDLWAFSDSG